MKRIMIIGSCGAGKSTLARRLSEMSGLPIVHLDQLYWKAGWKESEHDEFEEKVERAVLHDRWIIDGNYQRTIDNRLKRADTVFYLDYPATTCLWRAARRVRKYKGKTRPDMPEGCHERFDPGFFHYILTFNLRQRKSLLAKLKDVSDTVDVHVVKNDTHLNSILEKLNHIKT